MEPTSKPRRRLQPQEGKTNKKALLFAGGGTALVAAGLALYYFLVLAPSATHNELPVEFPVSAPHGDAVPVRYEVKPGDMFETRYLSETHFITVADDKVDLKEGMAFTVKFSVTHAVEEIAKDTPGAISKLLLFVDRSDSHVGKLKEDLRRVLEDPRYRYGVTYERDRTGRPIRDSIAPTKEWPGQRLALDGLLSGLGDLPSNALPAHDVRLGEAWDLFETMEIAPAEDVIRLFAQTNTSRDGFPAANRKGVVQAIGVEERGGETCLKLKIAYSMTVEGDVKAPARAGYISTAARVEGVYWVARSTGLVWELDVTSDIKTSYLVPNLATERKATSRITGTTKRVPFLRGR